MFRLSQFEKMDFSQLLTKEINKKRKTVESALSNDGDDESLYSSSSTSSSKKNSKKYLTKGDLLRAEHKIEAEEYALKRQKTKTSGSETNSGSNEGYARSEDVKDADSKHGDDISRQRQKRIDHMAQKKQEEERRNELLKEMEMVKGMPESRLRDDELRSQLASHGVKVPGANSGNEDGKNGSKGSSGKEASEERLQMIKKLYKLNTKALKLQRIALEDTIELLIDETDISNNPEKVCVQVAATVRTLLAEWKKVLDLNGDSTSESAKNVLKETIAYSKPLLSKLRSQEFDSSSSSLPTASSFSSSPSNFPSSLFTKLAHLFRSLQRHEFRAAHDTYLKMSIGNAAWPVGVTAVGIHARSAREKITGENNSGGKSNSDGKSKNGKADGGSGGGKVDVAHILSDEDTRKWLIAVKRFITFAEAHLKDKQFWKINSNISK